MQKREGRSFATPPTIPTRPDLGRTGRKGLPPQAALPPLTSALSRRAALFGAVTVASVTAAAVVPAAVQTGALSSRAATTSVAPPVSAEAAELREELCRLSSTYRRAAREADEAQEATAEVEPPEALYARAGDAQALWGRIPERSWAQEGRYWFGAPDIVEKLRADPLRYLDGSPSPGAARRDEIVAAWDGWRADTRAAEDASGYTEAQARFDAAYEAYEAFRLRLVEMRTADPEVLTVKAMALADLCRGNGPPLDNDIALALKRDHGAYRDALALSMARDFLGMLDTGVSA